MTTKKAIKEDTFKKFTDTKNKSLFQQMKQGRAGILKIQLWLNNKEWQTEQIDYATDKFNSQIKEAYRNYLRSIIDYLEKGYLECNMYLDKNYKDHNNNPLSKKEIEATRKEREKIAGKITELKTELTLLF